MCVQRIIILSPLLTSSSTIVMEVRFSHLWMAFLVTTRLIFRLPINTKPLSFSHAVPLLTRSFLSALRMLVPPSSEQCPRYAFHDIQHIVQLYLDDLLAHSPKFSDHSKHLHDIFICCRHYHICLNPHKYVLYVEFGRLLRFFVSKEGIHLDPLKVEAILNLSSPTSLNQLQSLQGKYNFLRLFIPNCAEITKGYTRLLKHDMSFV